MENNSFLEGSSNGVPRPLPDQESLRAEYAKLLPVRRLLIADLEEQIRRIMTALSSHLQIKGRLKSFESYFRKYIFQLKSVDFAEPRITDLIGVRIICLFLEDMAAVEKLLKDNFDVTEVERKGGDRTFREFGYDSVHLLLVIPEDTAKKHGIPQGETAEIQIRTILQDAWAEVEHELIYKAEFTPFDAPLKRKLAAVNASLSLADIIFQEIRNYQRELNGELGKRRDSFFRKIEDSTDALLFKERSSDALSDGIHDILSDSFSDTLSDSLSIKKDPEAFPQVNLSIDDLLLEALSAHNKNQFNKAIAIYTRIIEMKPNDNVSSLIYKHRGMAFFARSHYEEAIADFSESLKLDPKSYKAAYYKGVVCSVLKRYSQALEAFNCSLEINNYQPYCLYRRGQAYFHLEDFPRALGDCEAALALESFEAARKFKELLLSKLKM
ncbi:MAG: tetratricopeptide repeat protein [Treponema sp.]|nr:tetratricopeptide repeat protein [Treponema sp.]